MDTSWKLDAAGSSAVALLPSSPKLPMLDPVTDFSPNADGRQNRSTSRSIRQLDTDRAHSDSISDRSVTTEGTADDTAYGRYHIRVCRGTACHVKGSAAVLKSLEHSLAIMPGQATPDGNFSLEVVDCLDACGMSPVIAVNEQLYPGVTPHQVQCLVKDLSSE